MNVLLIISFCSVLGYAEPGAEDSRKATLVSYYAKKHGCENFGPNGDQNLVDLHSIQYCDIDGDGVDEAIVNGSDCGSGTGGPTIHDVLKLSRSGKIIDITPEEGRRSSDTFHGQPIFDTLVCSCNYDVSYRNGLLYYTYRDTSGKLEPLILKFRWVNGKFKLIEVVKNGLTLSSTRTPPAVSRALSLLHASSASLSASVQAGPVSHIR